MSTQCRPEGRHVPSVGRPRDTHGAVPAHHHKADEHQPVYRHGQAALTDGYNRMDGTYTASTTGPKELASYGGRITAWYPQPCVSQEQQPNVMAPHNIPPLRKAHNIPSHTHCPAQPATLKRQATSNNKLFTDALIHDLIAVRLDKMMAELIQRKGCEGAERTRLSSSNLNVGPPSKQNTGLLHLKVDSAAPRQFTSTASSEALGLSSAGNAGSSTLYCIGNKQLPTACGKGIPEEHAELTGDVEKQDGQDAKPTPESDSTEYPQIMMLAAAVCAKNEDENPVILSAISEFTEQDPDLKVGNNVTQEYTSSWLNVNESLDDLDKEPGARLQMSGVCHPEALQTGTRSVADAGDNLQAEQMITKTAEEHTEMDTADSIKMSVLSVQKAPCFKSQEYEDISEDESQNAKGVSTDLQSSTLPSETTRGDLSDTSSYDCQIYEDISDDEISRDDSLIVDEPLVTPNDVKQPTESQSPTNDPALAEKTITNGTTKGDETLWSTEEESCPNGGMNLQYNKGPGFDISCSSPEKYADCSPSAVIYISSDEDPIDFSTEGDGHTDPEMQENGTAVISSGLKVRSNFPQKHKATAEVPLKVRSCNSPQVLEVESTEVSQREDAEEDWVMIPVSIPHLRFDGSHVPLAKTKPISKNISPQPSTTKKPLPASSLSKLDEFDTLKCFIQSHLSKSSCSIPDSPIIVVSEDELRVPTPMEGNRIPTEPSNGSSSCDTEDSCDYSLSQSSHNYLTASSQCWENVNRRKSLKRKKKNLHSAKSPCTNTSSDSTDDSCVDDVQESLMTNLTMTPEAKSSPIESDKDYLKNNRTNTLKRRKILTADGAKFKKKRVLQKRHLAEDHRCQVKGPQQMISPDLEIDQEHPCVAGAEDPNHGLPEPNSIIPLDIFRMASEQSEPLKLKLELTTHNNKKDETRRSKEIKKTSQGNLANGHSSKPTLVSKEHLNTPKQLESRAALQRNMGHSTASSEPPRTASSSEHATPSPMETSRSNVYSRCLPTAPKRRISHCSSTNKTNDSKHQKPFSQRDRSTSPASRSKKGLFISSKIPSKHPSTASQNASVLEPHKQKHNSMASTPLMKRTKILAQRWMQAITPHNVGPEERRPSVGDGYKWKNANDSGNPGPSSPEYDGLASNKHFFEFF